MPHSVMDRFVAARTCTLITALAGFAIMITPILYFNAGLQTNSWNERVVGFLILCLAMLRLRNPASTTAASYANAGMGGWLVLSPWMFGYAPDYSRAIHSVGVGLAIVGFSIFSASFTRNLAAWARGQREY